MKKFISVIVAILLLAATAVPIAACTDNQTKGGSATGASDIEISDPVFGFIRSEDYDPETFEIESAAKWTTLDVDTSYYLFITFDITARRNNDGQSLLNVDFTFDALNVLEGTMEDVSTGMIEEMTFRDANTGNVGKTTTISFKIPSLSAEPKTINMIITMNPVKRGQSHIIVGYRYDAGSEYKLLGSDGYTKNLTIQAVQIEAPVLNVTEQGELYWNHVKNADYYLIYSTASQSPLTDWKNEVLMITADGTAVGGTIYFSIGEYDVRGFNRLYIRAFSNNNYNILNSDNSNTIEHTWL